MVVAILPALCNVDTVLRQNGAYGVGDAVANTTLANFRVQSTCINLPRIIFCLRS
jgi:hypothetical protein